ncbi:MAG TPA: hypothetical protein PLY66_15370 [Acidobacteriota bacterium]|nr:hypothetical protein [Acidobacteriota bacterium]HQF86035.1 hypothetical protein [Acidobacteriota bacterium]HQG90722.1 hypothetical protein [Acidobacteriota bacterium]HQK87495.1 hypothetical protein [Acidobacteriota bacterium]
MKKAWISALPRDEQAVQRLMVELQQLGYGTDGHFWTDDLAKMAWSGPREALLARETAVWVIVGTPADFDAPTVRYGLSMLSLGVQAQRGLGFPVILVSTGGAVDVATLPTPLRGIDTLALDTPALGTKIVAKAAIPPPKIAPEYRLDVYAVPGIGQWFEVGPAPGHAWKGAMFGVAGGEATIDTHGIGPAGRLPERCILNYPMQGLKLQLGGRDFTAWAIQNPVDDHLSYYLRVKEAPAAILFGAFPESDDAEVFTIQLQ